MPADAVIEDKSENSEEDIMEESEYLKVAPRLSSFTDCFHEIDALLNPGISKPDLQRARIQERKRQKKKKARQKQKRNLAEKNSPHREPEQENL